MQDVYVVRDPVNMMTSLLTKETFVLQLPLLLEVMKLILSYYKKSGDYEELDEDYYESRMETSTSSTFEECKSEQYKTVLQFLLWPLEQSTKNRWEYKIIAFVLSTETLTMLGLVFWAHFGRILNVTPATSMLSVLKTTRQVEFNHDWKN